MHIFCFCEGVDDQRFIERTIKPAFGSLGTHWIFYAYSQKTQNDVNKILVSAYQMKAHVIFLTDRDSCPCIQSAKLRVSSKFQRLDEKYVVVVEPEIEAWYLSGAKTRTLRTLRIRPEHVAQTTKERLRQALGSNHASNTPALLALLEEYSLDEGVARSRSLAYLCRRVEAAIKAHT